MDKIFNKTAPCDYLDDSYTVEKLCGNSTFKTVYVIYLILCVGFILIGIIVSATGGSHGFITTGGVMAGLLLIFWGLPFVGVY